MNWNRQKRSELAKRQTHRRREIACGGVELGGSSIRIGGDGMRGEDIAELKMKIPDRVRYRAGTEKNHRKKTDHPAGDHRQSGREAVLHVFVNLPHRPSSRCRLSAEGMPDFPDASHYMGEGKKSLFFPANTFPINPFLNSEENGRKNLLVYSVCSRGSGTFQSRATE